MVAIEGVADIECAEAPDESGARCAKSKATLKTRPTLAIVSVSAKRPHAAFGVIMGVTPLAEIARSGAPPQLSGTAEYLPAASRHG